MPSWSISDLQLMYERAQLWISSFWQRCLPPALSTEARVDHAIHELETVDSFSRRRGSTRRLHINQELEHMDLNCSRRRLRPRTTLRSPERYWYTVVSTADQQVIIRIFL